MYRCRFFPFVQRFFVHSSHSLSRYSDESAVRLRCRFLCTPSACQQDSSTLHIQAQVNLLAHTGFLFAPSFCPYHSCGLVDKNTLPAGFPLLPKSDNNKTHSRPLLPCGSCHFCFFDLSTSDFDFLSDKELSAMEQAMKDGYNRPD